MSEGARRTMAAIMLVFLTTLSVAARIKAPTLEEQPQQVPLPAGVEFLKFLIEKENPKDPNCANVQVPPKQAKSTRKRHPEGYYGVESKRQKVESSGTGHISNTETPDVRECAADGFLMSMNVQRSLQLYTQRTLGPMAEEFLAARAAKFADSVKGIPAEWEQFVQSEDTTQQFKERFQQLQNHRRSMILSDPDSKLCVFDDSDRIPVELYAWTTGKKDGSPRDPTDVGDNEYVRELLSDSDYFYIHEDKPIIAFIKIVTNKADAKRLKLPFADGWSPYVYSPLVCSAVKGGGTIAMQAILEFAVGAKLGRIVVSALAHVAWLYHGKAGATFIDRRGQDIDVSEFAQMKPQPNPISEKVAVSRGLMDPP